MWKTRDNGRDALKNSEERLECFYKSNKCRSNTNVFSGIVIIAPVEIEICQFQALTAFWNKVLICEISTVSESSSNWRHCVEKSEENLDMPKFYSKSLWL